MAFYTTATAALLSDEEPMNHITKHAWYLFTCSCLAASRLALAAEANEAPEPSVASPAAIDLLAGGTLDAWELPSARWALEGDSIVGSTGGEKIQIPEWIYTRQRYGDFVFTCELRMTGDERRNSGIYYRVTKFHHEEKGNEKAFVAPSGYEFDVVHPARVGYTGSLGDAYARPVLRIFPDPGVVSQAFKPEDWNRLTLRARGNRLEYWINGIKIMDFIDPDPKGSRAGVIGFQIHNGSVMKVEYRKIRVLSL